MASSEKRPMNHFFDDDPEYGEELNWDAWHKGETDSDLEREADEFNEYADAMQDLEDSDDVWGGDLPDDARDLPPGFPASLLEEPYHAPLSPSMCLEIFERMAQRQRNRVVGQQAESLPTHTDSDSEEISDHEARADDEASDPESPRPMTPRTPDNRDTAPKFLDIAACGPDRHLKSTRQRRDELNAVRRKPACATSPKSALQ